MGSTRLLLGGTAYRFAPSGDNTELNSAQLSSNATVVARDLAAKVDEFQTGTVEFTLWVNGQATPLTCTVTAESVPCNSGATTVTIPPASSLEIRVDISSAAGASDLGWSFRALTPEAP